ncbi:hypothetical protein [Clostridium botulinum]|uniref:Uncharacterized protein n=1 Tax=Clostridium botulinum TaxID=1491 RepID=A0A9Q1ZBG0_CLOBO|nr:hypothetical protein [Clostridium botulinum]AEB74762.1 hypothetical protein CbC4_0079 [Clostridium botulinum BKT015925]KEI01824.1 hypothetical protein Y848_08645 [Clostridium botulinum C/D str. Sp77]KEI02793.1 hypothetical protein Z953_06205 [Clostridium botulinum D str. 16868]KLU76220.1 hypothetical protein CBC3_04865 [Clostridium botulinum V891]KOA74605.1 hypothetical protein ADU78_10290 [Clostridium botulinum]
MRLANIIENIIDESLVDIENRLKCNLMVSKWEIENVEDLRTIEGKKVKIYFGVTSPFGGVKLTSFIGSGGGYVPYYIKLTEDKDYKTKVTAIVTGSEFVNGDVAKRNENISKLLIDMCRKDCNNRSFKDKVKYFFD